MNFGWDETEAMIRDMVRSFVDGRVRESAMRWNEGHGSAIELVRELGELGLLGVLMPESKGGAELGAMSLVATLTELAEGDAGLASMVAHHNALALMHLHLAKWNDKPLMASFCSGTNLLCHADVDGGAHADAPILAARAVQKADQWQVTGTKRWVPMGSHASHAIVSADTAQGARAFLIALDAKGVKRTPSPALVGLRSADFADLSFDNSPVIADLDLIAPHREKLSAYARLCVAALSVGIARAALMAGVTYSLERQQFGKPIARFQPIQWQTADSETELQAAQLLLWRAAWSLEQGKRAPVSKAAIFAANMALKVADRALQMHGGYGYTADFPVERHYRDAVTVRKLADGVDVQRVELAKHLATHA